MHDQDTSKLSPLAALQAYHAYAEQQLAIAGGHELTAADVLYGLAKLQPHLDVAGANQDSYDGPVAMSYYQAALLIYPDHYLAANELGVLFARLVSSRMLAKYCDSPRRSIQIVRKLG